MSQHEILAVFALILVLVALSGGYIPLRHGGRLRDHPAAAFGEALAVGVFLGAGLIHMLSDSTDGFETAGYAHIWPDVICGATLLVLLAVEHFAGRLSRSSEEGHPAIALLAAGLLSVHTFLAGAALGTSQEASVALVVFLALLAHKFAASFALGMTLSRSALAATVRWGLFAVFVVMLPLGVLAGAAASSDSTLPLLAPVLTAVAAGTFIHLALLHGLERSMVVKHCRDVRLYSLVVVGFALMAVLAIWT